MEVVCPIDCVRAACPDPDFLEKHEGLVLTLIAACSATVGMLLQCVLKSRCTLIRTPCWTCHRDVLELEAKDVNLEAGATSAHA